MNKTDRKTLERVLWFLACLLLAATALSFVGYFVWDLAVGNFNNNYLSFLYVFIIMAGGGIALTILFASLIFHKKFYNPFIIIGVILSLLTITIGFSAVASIYRSPFPLQFSPGFFHDENLTYMAYCNSLPNSCDIPKGCEYPVTGHYMTCDFIVYNLTNVSYYNVEYTINHYLSDSVFQNMSYGGELKKIDNGIAVVGFRIPIKKEGFNELYITLILNPNSQQQKSLSYPLRYTAINEETYDRKVNEKNGLYILIITFGLVSSFSVSKNLMDIWDRKMPRKRKKKSRRKR